MFCSSAQHGREKKRDILVAESTRESCSPIQPFILILFLHWLKLLTKPRAAISSEIRSYTFLLRRIPSKLAFYFDISSTVNNGGDFVVRPIYVYCFFCFPVVGIDASAAEAILSSSELVTRLRSRLAIPGCIAPGSVTRCTQQTAPPPCTCSRCMCQWSSCRLRPATNDRNWFSYFPLQYKSFHISSEFPTTQLKLTRDQHALSSLSLECICRRLVTFLSVTVGYTKYGFHQTY